MNGNTYASTHPATRKAWRQWLEKNHAHSQGVWLIYYKKESGKQKLTYADAVEEALCFGWIDSRPGKLDEERTMLKFSPRKPKSVWSQLNKTRIIKLVKEGKMTTAGLQKIKLAKKNGSWDTLTSSDQHAKNNSMPADLLLEMNKNKMALENFRNFPAGYRRQFLSWIDSAKRPETKSARIRQTIQMALANKKPGTNGFKL